VDLYAKHKAGQGDHWYFVGFRTKRHDQSGQRSIANLDSL